MQPDIRLGPHVVGAVGRRARSLGGNHDAEFVLVFCRGGRRDRRGRARRGSVYGLLARGW